MIAGLVSIRNEKGVTAIEYGLLAALISLAIIGAVTLLGVNLADVFGGVAEKVAVPAG
ncbi:Flp family type IVb pilin [Sphingobium sp. H33]|uniref:Flp family type IVb pilin n=2 Tax=Sphingobium nicotianae TaxID=2782607 RepID=A0A9X1DFR3_9SPHN|nr:Flp family type IVb pilin [Sphingobium nicotianae]